MDDIGGGFAGEGGFEEGEHFVTVGVCGEAVEGVDGAAEVVEAVEDAEAGGACGGLDAAAECVGGCPADEDDGVVGVFDGAFEVVEDAAELAGGAGGDDDGGAGVAVDGAGLFCGDGEGDMGEAEEVAGVAVADGRAGFLVEGVGVALVDPGDFGAHGGIDEEGDFGDVFVLDEALDVPEEGLGASDGEGGEDHAAAAGDGGAEDLKELGADLPHRGVPGEGVGAFGDDVVERAVEGGRVAEDGGGVASDVGGEEEAAGLLG